MIYLASPYSHPDSGVCEFRYRAACQAAAALLRSDLVVFSPIVHSHPLVEYGLPKGWTYWERHDRVYIELCDLVLVLMLDGWRESVGVQAELRIAQELGKPIRYLDPNEVQGSRILTGLMAESAEPACPR